MNSRWLRDLLRCRSFLLGLLPICLALSACASPVIKMPKVLPDIVKTYKSITVYGSMSGMEDSGIAVQKGDSFTIVAKGEILVWPQQSKYTLPITSLTYRIGKNEYYRTWWGEHAIVADAAGSIYLGHADGPLNLDGSPRNPEYYRDNQGFFVVDIIVWAADDPVRRADFMQDLTRENPQETTVPYLASVFQRLKEVHLAKERTTQDLAATQQALATLTQTPPPPGPAAAAQAEQVAALTARLEKAQQALQELEALKQQLATQQVREQALTTELARLQADPTRPVPQPPVIALASPPEGAVLETDTVTLAGVAEHAAGLLRLEITLNGRPVPRAAARDVQVGPTAPRRLEFSERLRLREGPNTLTVTAHSGAGTTAQATRTLQVQKAGGRVWAVLVGINTYKHLPPLKYAVADAQALYRYLVEVNRIPPAQITLLLDQEATLDRLRSVLGTQLRRQAAKADTVLVFLAGHGATERDATSLDGDGLEKYLLPVNADPTDLYATALPMAEVARIFQRIAAERLVFLADTCYSGASGGRTVPVPGTRATLNPAFLDRLTQGKGRVLLTASAANEVSAETDALQHGVFTYYLLEALHGKGDFDHDGFVTVDEVYRYVSTQVPQATGQTQHPVKKGEVTGQLVLGVVGGPRGE